MPKCPICSTPLETARQREGVFYPCPSCKGRAVTVSQVRHVLGEPAAMKLLRLMRTSTHKSHRQCPFCSNPMLVVSSQEPLLAVDACRTCNALWFDEPTYQSLPEISFGATNAVTMQATEIIAMERLEELKKRMEQERKQARNKKLLHRNPKPEKNDRSDKPSD